MPSRQNDTRAPCALLPRVPFLKTWAENKFRGLNFRDRFPLALIRPCNTVEEHFLYLLSHAQADECAVINNAAAVE